MFKPFKARHSIRSPVKFRSPMVQKKQNNRIKEIGVGSPEPRVQSDPPTSIQKNPNKTGKATMISLESTKTSGEGESPKTPLSPIHKDEGEIQGKGMGEIIPSPVDPPPVTVETDDIKLESDDALDKLIS